MAGESLFRKVKNTRRLFGEIILPGDKSISHRALMLSSLAKGSSTLINIAPGDDCKSTAQCLKSLGIKIRYKKDKDNTLIVEGQGNMGLAESPKILNANNSGTTLRLLAGILSTRPFLSIINGDASLRRRPMRRLIEPLRHMGAEICGVGDDSFAPLVIRGKKLKGMNYNLNIPSAQIKSAILLAGLFASGQTIINQSQISRNHTELMLAQMGATIKTDSTVIILNPLVNHLEPLSLFVPGDISSAAYWLVAAAVHPNAEITVRNCGINPTRTGILDVLQDMGAKISLNNKRFICNEAIADITVRSSSLSAIEIKGEDIPRLIDEIPIIAVAACFAKGKSIIKDATELKVKESDRIATTVSELSRLGAKIEKKPDGMIITGGHRLTGAVVQSYNDHRLAMSMAIAGLIAQGETIIRNAQVVKISYPGFWADLERIT